MTIIWSANAENRLGEIYEFVAQDNERAAERLLMTILAAVDRLARMPHLGRLGRVTDTRELPVPGTPYVLPYIVDHQDLIILSVQHGAQEWPESFERK